VSCEHNGTHSPLILFDESHDDTVYGMEWFKIGFAKTGESESSRLFYVNEDHFQEYGWHAAFPIYIARNDYYYL